MTKPRFNGTSISSLESLSSMLGIDKPRLEWIIKTIPKSYKTFPIKTGRKKKERSISEPKKALKAIQKKINKEIFENVTYPSYLHGGLKEKDYISNATSHTKKKTIICMDIQDFYPSISKRDVHQIFQYLMHFSPEVSSALTELVTLDGKVPQGACCSSYIANLIFFNKEFNIVNKLSRKGLSYTRLLDDITVSSDTDLSDAEKTEIIQLVTGMAKSYRLSINKNKTSIEHSKDSNANLHVTGLWVKHGIPKLTKEDRRYIRYLVFICKKDYDVKKDDPTYHELWNKCSGKVAQMERLGHSQAKELRQTLSEILPIYDEFRIKKCIMFAKRYIKTFSPPLSEEQISKVNKLIYKFGIVARTHKNLAKLYRQELRSLLPIEKNK